MTARIFLITALGVISAAVASAEGSGGGREVSSDVGRFQLFQGTYTALDLKRQETYTPQAVFLIDTKTGLVKRYVSKIDTEGKYTELWVPIDGPAPAEKK